MNEEKLKKMTYDYLSTLQEYMGMDRFMKHRNIIVDFTEEYADNWVSRGRTLEEFFSDSSLPILVLVICAMQDTLELILKKKITRKEEK